VDATLVHPAGQTREEGECSLALGLVAGQEQLLENQTRRQGLVALPEHRGHLFTGLTGQAKKGLSASTQPIRIERDPVLRPEHHSWVMTGVAFDTEIGGGDLLPHGAQDRSVDTRRRREQVEQALA
jgi:hypothetical protein